MKDMAELKRRLELQEEIERELENAARNYSSQVHAALWLRFVELCAGSLVAVDACWPQSECIAQIERILDELDRKVDRVVPHASSPIGTTSDSS